MAVGLSCLRFLLSCYYLRRLKPMPDVESFLAEAMHKEFGNVTFPDPHSRNQVTTFGLLR